MSRLREYLSDPSMKTMYDMVRAAGAVRPISLDITSKCNLRCTGCYYYAEEMDKINVPRDDRAFDELVRSEKERGTNFVTVVGGEPALVPGASFAEQTKCIHGQFLRNPTDCTSFYQCVWSRPVRMTCPPGLYFNPRASVCDWPFNVPEC